MRYKILANLCAVAVIALGAPRRPLIRLKKAPRAVLDRWSVFAAKRKACAARLFEDLVLLLNTFPPEILLPGHNPSHEQKCFTVRHLDISVPISERMVKRVLASMPGIAVKSIPRQIVG